MTSVSWHWIGLFLAEKIGQGGAFEFFGRSQNFSLTLKDQNGIPPEISDYNSITQEIMVG